MTSPATTPERRAAETVVVTGASAGLGRSLACAFALRGARVALIARGEDGLAGAVRDVEARGGTALAIPADVADAAAIERAAARVEDELGPIDVWVNNAMVSVFSPIAETTPEEFRRVTEVTYLGAVNGTLAALRRMRARNHGTIVQVGSALAFRAIPLQAAYCAAKHAMQGFTESLRCELAHDRSRVRVSMVEMPALNTPQFDWVRTRLPGRPQPVPPIYQPEVGARAVLWAIDSGRTETYVGWPTVAAVIGNKLVPRIADWYLARTGYRAQQMAERVEPGRPDNLWEPLPGDHGAHGAFDARALDSSSQLWLSMHRRWLGLAVGAIALGALVARHASARRRRRLSGAGDLLRALSAFESRP